MGIFTEKEIYLPRFLMGLFKNVEANPRGWQLKDYVGRCIDVYPEVEIAINKLEILRVQVMENFSIESVVELESEDLNAWEVKTFRKTYKKSDKVTLKTFKILMNYHLKVILDGFINSRVGEFDDDYRPTVNLKKEQVTFFKNHSSSEVVRSTARISAFSKEVYLEIALMKEKKLEPRHQIDDLLEFSRRQAYEFIANKIGKKLYKKLTIFPNIALPSLPKVRGRNPFPSFNIPSAAKGKIVKIKSGDVIFAQKNRRRKNKSRSRN